MKKWEGTTISAAARVVTGKTPPTAREDLFIGDLPFFSPKDLDFDSFHVSETSTKINEEAFRIFHNQILPKKSILYTSLSYGFGKIGINTIPALTNQQISSLIPRQGYSTIFLYYLLRASTPYIFTFNSGIDTPIVPKSVFEKIKLPIPELPIQRKIAAILSAYDDLIETNERRIALLEKMAEELYREWFVRMRFPGHEQTSFSTLPDGWEEKTLTDVTEIIDCLHTKKPEEKTDGEGWLIQLENILENGRFDTNYQYRISNEDYSEWIKNIELIEGDCLITNVGRIAAIAQIPSGVRAAPGRNMTAVRPRGIPPSFLIQFLLSPHMKEEVNLKQDPGSIMNSLNVRNIHKIRITVPNNLILEEFDQIVRPIIHQRNSLLQQSIYCRVTRDRLLSRLMSGALDVEERKIAFPPSMEEELAAEARKA